MEPELGLHATKSRNQTNEFYNGRKKVNDKNKKGAAATLE
jgi:hypothetical protein